MTETPAVPQNEVRNYPDLARQVIKDYYNAYIADLSDDKKHGLVDIHDVYVVSGMKTLHHWKGTLATTNPDNLYFEVTYNGVTDEIYVDQYAKVQQLVLKGGEPATVENFPVRFGTR